MGFIPQSLVLMCLGLPLFWKSHPSMCDFVPCDRIMQNHAKGLLLLMQSSFLHLLVKSVSNLKFVSCLFLFSTSVVIACFCELTHHGPVLKITAGQWTMSEQNGELTGQKLHSPAMLTGHAVYTWINNQILNFKSWIFNLLFYDLSHENIHQRVSVRTFKPIDSRAARDRR